MNMRERFPLGKVPSKVLSEVLFRYLGQRDESVILGPQLGEDAAVIKLDEGYLVVSTDPITAAEREIGWLAVHISANDVAVTGARPRWFLSSILLSEDIDLLNIKHISKQIGEAAKSLGIAVIGGHTEITPGLQKHIVVGMAMGLTDRYITSSGARPGDKIIQSKGIGFEGISILASAYEAYLQKKLQKSTISEAKKLREKISVVREALALADHDWLTAMHDPTEGGLFLGLHELADASKTGLKIYRDKIIITEPVRRVCEVLKVDVFSLLSSGTLLASVHPRCVDEALGFLSATGEKCAVIGEMLSDSEERVLVDSTGGRKPLPKPVEDAIWKLIEE
ncbi:MAG: hydrogenase [Nitrososphaeria archaeon]|nr:hydrogenase [Nitrososphaeria archaeon]NIQ33164.1 hydrogenase [Nitrososphaeria archaeon]